jgi:hypothetical protein
MKDTIDSLFSTIMLYFGGMGMSDSVFSPFTHSKIPEYMEFANLEFIKDVMDWELEPRHI